MPVLTLPRGRRLHIAMKDEGSSYGVDAFGGTYTAADIIPAAQIQPSLNVQEIENLGLGGQLGRNPSIPGPQTGGVTFVQPIRGKDPGVFYDDSPLVVPESHLPMLGCGHAATFVSPGISGSTVKYAPTNTHKSMTIYVVQENAATLKLVGCVGSWGFVVRAGGELEFRFGFQGLIDDTADVAFVEPSIPQTPAYPTAKSALFQIDTTNYAPRIAQISFEQQNQILPVPSVNSAGGLVGYFIAGRNPRLSIDPEGDTVANYDWFAKWIAATLADCTFQVGATLLNKFLFNFPKLQIVNQGYSNRDGLTAFPTTLLATVTTGLDDYDVTAA